MNTTLLTLAAVGSPRHSWSEYSDIIRNSAALIDADQDGFTVLTSTGSQRVTLPSGLTDALYEYLAPWCDDREKGLLAKGCLHRHLAVDWRTWSRFNAYLRRELGNSLEEWLPDAVSQHGFQRVGATAKDALAQFRIEFPATPNWYSLKADTFILDYGVHGRWLFESRAAVQIAIISALAKSNWKPVEHIEEWHSRAFRRRQSQKPLLMTLDTLQIKFALNDLRKKTRGVMDWHEHRAFGASWESLV